MTWCFLFRRKAVIGLVKRFALGNEVFSCDDVFVLLGKTINGIIFSIS